MAATAPALHDRLPGRAWVGRSKKFSAVDAHVARRLHAARKASGLSQEKAAEAIGLTFQQVQKYEHGTNRITVGRLAALADVYGKPLAWFFEDLDGINPKSASCDPMAAILSAPHGRELIEAYVAIKDRNSQHTVVVVAAALAGRQS